MAGPMKPNDPNRNDQNGGGEDKKRSPWSFFSIVMWAIMLVLLLHMCTSSMENASVQKVDYATFRQWVVEGYVDSVNIASNVYTFTLKADAPPLQEYLEKLAQSYGQGGLSQLFGQLDTGSLSGMASETIKFQTAPISRELADWLSENGVPHYETELVTNEEYMLSAIVSYVLPVVIMVVAMLFIYRYMFKKMGSGGGGFGGIGCVGKSNA